MVLFHFKGFSIFFYCFLSLSIFGIAKRIFCKKAREKNARLFYHYYKNFFPFCQYYFQLSALHFQAYFLDFKSIDGRDPITSLRSFQGDKG